MKIEVLPVTPFEQNCSLLCCTETGRAALIDPGGDVDRLYAATAQARVEIEKVLVTHGHFDHVGAVGEVAAHFGVPIEGPHEDDRFLIQALPEWCTRFGFPGGRVFEPDRWLTAGDEVQVGSLRLEVRHCPGHTPGHVIFFHPGEQIAIVGDVIFNGSIGRTDFPRGDHATLLRSIREQIFTLGDETVLLPGHGPTTTVGEERAHNPFVQGRFG
jgi:glyoxylase-like metal-dependent hydrolase (beta-lactamase superfamily II)